MIIYNNRRRQACRFKSHDVYKLLTLCVCALFLFSGIAFAQNQEIKKSAKSGTTSIDVKGMDVIDVLKILADDGGFNISIGSNVSGRVTLFLKDINVWDALEIVLAAGNLAYEKKGDIIYVMSDRDYELKYGNKYWDKRRLKVFTLKYRSAAKVKEMLLQVASSVGKVIVDEATNTIVVIDVEERIYQMADIIARLERPIETKVYELDYLPVKNLEQQLSQTLTKDVGFVKIDEISNKIIVTDYAEKLEQVDKFLSAFDEKPLQVLIDSKIVEIKPSRKFYSGINWDHWIKKYFKVTETFTIPTTSAEKLSIGATGVPVGEPGQYSGMLEFLEIFGESRVLSSPRILVVNNQEAKILVGTKDAYITSSVSQSDSSAITSQEVNYVDVGVKLYVTPTINRKGYITLKIKPEISSSERKQITSDDKITEIPIVSTSEAETTVMVKDGVSVIIGGLRKVSRDKERKQVPVLGKIPFLGALFRNKSDEWIKSELVIVLTPRIISGDKSIEMEINEKMAGAMGETEVLDEFRKDYKAGGDDLAQDSGLKQNSQYPGDGKASGKVFEKQNNNMMAEPASAPTPPADKDREWYYSKIIEKIRQTLSFVSAEGREEINVKANIKVKFSLDKDGKIDGEPRVVSSDTDERMDNVAKEIIRQSSPFPSVPYYRQDDKEVFEVLLMF